LALKKIFFILPQNQRLDFFKGLIADLSSNKDNQLFVFSNRDFKVEGIQVDENVRFIDLTYSQLRTDDIGGNFSAGETLVRESELKVGIPSSRILISDERKVGAGFRNQSWRWFSDPLASLVIKDPKNANKLLVAAFLFWNLKIRELKPSVIIAGSSTGLFNGALYYLSVYHGISYMINRRSKILDDRYFWTSSWLEKNDKCEKLVSEFLKEGREPSEFASSFISSFAKKPRTIKYISKNWSSNRQNSFFGKLRLYLGTARASFEHSLGLRKGDKPIGVLQRLHSDFLAMLSCYFSTVVAMRNATDNLVGVNYVYLPLHKEPELALNKYCPLWHDQLHLVRWVSCNLPVGHTLVVKDHRFNVQRRTVGFYRAIKGLPNVILVNSQSDQFQLIQGSKLVLTINGSTGFEALALGRPMIFFGASFYDKVAASCRLREAESLGEKLLEKLGDSSASKFNKDALKLLVDAELLSTYPERCPKNKRFVERSLDECLPK
jgi:hypothetical protein